GAIRGAYRRARRARLVQRRRGPAVPLRCDSAAADRPVHSTPGSIRHAFAGPADPIAGMAPSLRMKVTRGTTGMHREVRRMKAQTTLLDLVTAVSDVANNEDEVVATVLHPVNSRPP